MRHKTVKDVEKTLSGGEPYWRDGNGVSVAEALNWYNYHSDHKESKKYAIQYLKEQKKSKTVIEFYSKISENHYGNLGFVCRIKMNGANLTDHNLKWIDNAFETLKQKHVEPKEKVEVEKKPTVSIQDRLADKSRDYISELENEIDECITSRDFKTFSPYNWMQKNEIKGAHTKFIIARYNKVLEELDLAITGKDQQLNEGYSNFKKTELKAFRNLISTIVTDAEKLNDNSKRTRMPRKKKAKPVEKVVSKVIYKKQDTEYKLASINPSDIIGCSQLWVFNTKTRKLGVYVANDSDGLSVKGTTIQNFKEDESVQKTVRKPEVVLPQTLKAGKIALRKVLPGINAVEQNLTGRLNSDTILLRVIK